MSGGSIAAQWAWISKDPDAGIGYSVLATSDCDTDFGPFIGRYVSGSPSSTARPDAPDAPPWVTFGPVATERNEILISVSVRDPWQERDHAGRPIWPQRLFIIPFADLAAADASYQTVWEVAREAAVPATDRMPLHLGVKRQPLGELTQTIKRHGFEQLAQLAAAVLEGHVAVAEAAALQREERLAVLDAVAALLPYGLRADLSVSSSVDNTATHGIRLVFAHFGNSSQQLLSLRDPRPSLRNDIARRYLETLREKKRRVGLEAVLGHLWFAKRPHLFDDPRNALAVLDDLDFYGSVGRAFRDGRATKEQFLKFFADQAAAQRYWPDMSQEARENAISPVLTHRDVTAASAVFSCWEIVADDVTRLINRHLDAGGVEDAAWCLKAARVTPGGATEDRLLGDLLVPEQQIAADRQQQRIAMLVELLQRHEVPAPGEFRYTCDALRYGDHTEWQAHLVRELLVREAAAETGKQRALAWVRWLSRSEFAADWRRPSWIAALDCVLPAPAGDEAVESLRSMITRDVAWAAVLLRLAEPTGCLPSLLEQADRQLVELAAALSPPFKPGGPVSMLRDELHASLWALDVRPGTVASIDVARVLLGGEPRDFPSDLNQQALDRYGDGLGFAFALDAVKPRRAQGRVRARCLVWQVLFPHPPSEPRGRLSSHVALQ